MVSTKDQRLMVNAVLLLLIIMYVLELFRPDVIPGDYGVSIALIAFSVVLYGMYLFRKFP